MSLNHLAYINPILCGSERRVYTEKLNEMASSAKTMKALYVLILGKPLSRAGRMKAMHQASRN